MQVTASNKYENVYPHQVPNWPNVLPQFVWIKPRPSVSRKAGVLEALGIRGNWGDAPWDKGIRHGVASELLLELAPRKSLQNRQNTGTKELGGRIGCAKCRVEAGIQFCQAGGQRGVFPLHPTRPRLRLETKF